MNQTTTPTEHYPVLNLATVIAMVCIKRSKLYMLISQGQFPRPIKIGASSRWLRSEVLAWIEQRALERDALFGSFSQTNPPANFAENRI